VRFKVRAMVSRGNRAASCKAGHDTLHARGHCGHQRASAGQGAGKPLWPEIDG